MTYFNSLWTHPSGAGPRGAVPSSAMRVSDAERTEVAETLSKHFSDGRLDQSEFDERLQRTMSAKTRGDLAGLTDDLPPLPGTAPPRPGVGRRIGIVLLVTLLLAATFASAPFAWHVPWVLFAIVFFVFFRYSRGARYRHHRWQDPLADQPRDAGPQATPWF